MLGAQTGLYKLWSKEKEQSQETQLGAQTGLYKEIDSTNDAKSKKVFSTKKLYSIKHSVDSFYDCSISKPMINVKRIKSVENKTMFLR